MGLFKNYVSQTRKPEGVLGSVHGLMFVLYQITAAILVTGVAGKAFDRIKAPGVAACLGLGMILTFSSGKFICLLFQ